MESLWNSLYWAVALPFVRDSPRLASWVRRPSVVGRTFPPPNNGLTRASRFKNFLGFRPLCLTLVLTASLQTAAQTAPINPPKENQQKEAQNTGPSTCTHAGGLDMVRQQVAASKLIDDTSQRISVMLRAADLIWVWDADTSRSTFKDALDIATDDYQEKSGHQGQSPSLGSAVVDMRYKVVAAIARRDLDWARKLSDQILKEQEDRAANEATNHSEQNAATAERLLGVAFSLLTSDESRAIVFATTSLRYPATSYLPSFLYKLSEIDKPAADQLYQRALSAYGGSPMNQFLFLSSYPFGNNREAGEMPNWTVYLVPSNFKASPNLQRLFLTAFIQRARLMNENPSATDAGARFSDSDQAWIALTRLKPQIDQFMPDLSGEAEQIRQTLFTIHDQAEQQKLTNTTTSPPQRSFAETVEQGERLANPARREQVLALAILHTKNEPLEQVVEAAAKIDDSDLRDNLLSWVYFERAQQAVSQDLGLAQKLAEKVRELDLRAYLFTKIAEALIKQTKIDNKARELLEAVLDAAAKAPETEVKARTLLGVAYLYSKIDANRSIAILGDAVKCINKIESPDFSSDYMERKIKGQAFTSYALLQTPGFNPENSFRELGKIDFEGTRTLAASFANKYLRSTITLVLADQCLQSVDQQQKRNPNRERGTVKP